MNNFYKLTILFFLLCVTNLAYAQSGTVRGTVIEDANGEPLYGVNVYVPSTSNGTTTDFDGKFELNLPAGTYDLRISYVSYQQITITGVKVKAGDVTVLDRIRLRKKVEEMKEVVVTAEAVNISEAALMTKKKKAANLIDGISAETFKKVGVSDAAQALKKVTGVSVEGGKYVYIRGLGDRYSNVMMNSVEIPSLDPNKNSLQIDIFPTELIDNMVITKTAVASMPADFAGGIVNIDTKDFPDKPIFDISLSLGYNPSMHFNSNFLTYEGSSTDFLGFDNGARDLPTGAEQEDIPNPVNPQSTDQEINNFVNSFSPELGPTQKTDLMNYSLGLSVGNQFDVGGSNKIGYIFSGTYKNTNQYFDNYQYGEYQTQTSPDAYDLIYATKQHGNVSKNNVLLGGLAGIAFKTNRSKYKLTAMHLQNGESKATNFFMDNSQTAPGQSGFFADSYALEYSQRGITNVMLNGTHYFDNTKWQVDWKISPTFSNMKDPDLRRTTYTISEDGSNPRFSAGAGGYPNRIWRYLDEVNWVGRLNVTRDYKLFGEEAKLNFGGSYVYKQRDFKIISFQLQSFGNWPDLTGDPSEVLQEQNIYPNGTEYYVSANPDPNPNAYSSNVNNYAYFVSNEFTLFPNLKVNIGLRAEQYILRHTGRDPQYAQGDETNGHNLDNAKVLESFDLFPSANLTYFLGENQNLRLSYSKTVARPSFKEMSYAQIIDPASNRIFNGGLFSVDDWDGNLHQTRIQNFDLRWEKYFKSDQLLSLSLFYKLFDDPIELVRLHKSPTTSEFQPRNVGDGKVFGAELELRKSLNFLSSSLTNFGVSGNLTLAKSIIQMTQQEFDVRKSREKNGENIDNKRPMAGQAPYIINAGLTYNNPSMGLDAGLFYNVEGETITVVGGGLYPDVYSQPFNSLKFNLNKSFGHYSLSLHIDNILGDSQQEMYQSFRADNQIFTSYNPHTSASIGFKYSF
jgi:TonB-dependent receptor